MLTFARDLYDKFSHSGDIDFLFFFFFSLSRESFLSTAQPSDAKHGP